jgi:hypothetical protein
MGVHLWEITHQVLTPDSEVFAFLGTSAGIPSLLWSHWVTPERLQEGRVASKRDDEWMKEWMADRETHPSPTGLSAKQVEPLASQLK